VCILEKSYNQTLAFRIDGSDGTYLGEEDLHDTRYDYLEEFADINAHIQSRAGPETRSYTEVPLNKEFGKYTLQIYPSRETEEEFDDINVYVQSRAGPESWSYTEVPLNKEFGKYTQNIPFA
jgi:hypothetical protein